MPPSSTLATEARAAPRVALSAVPAWAITAVLAAIWVLVDPPTPDLAAHAFRAALFEQEGFSVWNNAWYGGHHLPGYSLLFPMASALLTPQIAAALASVVSSWCFDRLATGHWGAQARAGILWFAVAAVSPLVAGQLAFGFALAFALGSLLAAQTGRGALAIVLAAATTLASPVAALFLCMAAAAWLLVTRSRLAAAVLAAAVIPGLALAVAFPEGGVQPYVLTDVLSLAAGALIVFALIPREEKILRVGAGLYVLGILAAGLIDTPVGGNVVRLGALLAGPILLCALWGRRPAWVLILISVPLLIWQWSAPARNVVRGANDPSHEQRYYEGLIAELDSRAVTDGPGRIEIPFTRSHWETRWLPSRFPQARGWERQLDVGRNTLFYDDEPLTAERYRAWIDEQAVRWVAVPDAPLDGSAEEEAALIASGAVPWLRPVWRDEHWTLYAVRDPMPLATQPLRVTSMDTDAVRFVASRPGTGVIRVRWTPYWQLRGAEGCVEPAGDWTRVTVRRAGLARLVTQFSPWRIGRTTPRCST